MGGKRLMHGNIQTKPSVGRASGSGPVKGRWNTYSDRELVEYAQDQIRKYRIIARREFYDNHGTETLYSALENRGLLEEALKAIGEPSEKPLDANEKVKFMRSFSCTHVYREYRDGSIISFDGQVMSKQKKDLNGRFVSVHINDAEKKQFMEDVEMAAKTDAEIERFLKYNPFPS